MKQNIFSIATKLTILVPVYKTLCVCVCIYIWSICIIINELIKSESSVVKLSPSIPVIIIIKNYLKAG